MRRHLFISARSWTVALLASASLLAAWSNTAYAWKPASESASEDKPSLAKAPANPVPSLDIVPDDAVFYSAMLRNREQWDAMVGSHAWSKLKDMPLVQMGLGLYAIQSADPESVAGKFQAVLGNSQLRKPIDLMIDMVSDEVFVYGGRGMVNGVQLMQQMQNVQRLAPLSSAMNGQAEPDKASAAQAKAILNLLVSQADKLEVPEMIIGFHVKNRALGQEMLDRLFETGSDALEEQAKLKGRLKKVTVEGRSYITLTLDGSMIPWEDAKLDNVRAMVDDPAKLDKLIEHIKEMKLVVSLGMRDDYMILGMGPSTDVLTRLGSGNSLHSRKELAPLARHAHKALLSVGYVSEALQRAMSMSKADLEALPNAIKTYLPALKVPANMRREIMRDVNKMTLDIKDKIPEAGATLAFNYRVEGGQEGFTYDWSEHKELDGSKSLSLLNHIGGNPIAAMVTRGKYDRESYDMLVKWIGVGYGYFEKYGLPKMKESEQAEYKVVAEKMMPLIKRAHEVTREKLLPSLADGQIAFVLDARLKSKQFAETMPVTPIAMPMAEPALVLGVSDAALLRKAFEEYYDIADQCVGVVKTIKDSKIPEDFKIPRPTVTTTSGGTIYGYKVPETCGVDAQIMPNAALSEHVAVLSLSQKHSERLLSTMKPEMAGRELPVNRPAAVQSGFDFAALIDAVTPWIDYGVDTGLKNAQAPFDKDSVQEQVHTVLDVLKVFRGSVSMSYFENKAFVTRWHSEIHDLAE